MANHKLRNGQRGEWIGNFVTYRYVYFEVEGDLQNNYVTAEGDLQNSYLTADNQFENS